jgi:ribosomal protein S18 acetylase RimI-like enzyme
MSNSIAYSCAPIVVRTLQQHDIPSLMRIQSACYGQGFIESADVYTRRLASPVNCSLAVERAGQVCGYLAAYRSRHGKVTPLHGTFGDSAEAADTLYLHDMAVSPAHAGQGLALALLDRLWEQGRASGLLHTALVSVQDSRDFWARHGYVPQRLGEMEERSRLASYGEGAVYMARPLWPPT